jgi:phosphoketolase
LAPEARTENRNANRVCRVVGLIVEEGIVRIPDRIKITGKPLTSGLFHTRDAYWHAASDLSVGQVCLYDDPLLKGPQTLADVIRRRSAGIWGVCPTVG